jgi:hypothetical protein
MTALIKISILFILETILLTSCTSSEKYKKDLLSDDINKIDNACYELGELKDTSAIKLLLTKALDPRISHNLKFKGMSVNYCRLGALKKISGVEIGRKIDQFRCDTTATQFYLDWAVEHGYLKDRNEVDINYNK